MSGSQLMSRIDILDNYKITESTLIHLEELELFTPSDTKVVRGERRYILSQADKDVLSLASCWFPNLRSQKLYVLPYQRAVTFYILTRGPEGAYRTLLERGFISGKRPTRAYFEMWHSALIDNAPKGMKKWVRGDVLEPGKNAVHKAETYLAILGLEDVWEDPDLADMPFIYETPMVRTTVEGLLSTAATYEDIAAIIEAKFDLDVTERDIELYNQLYFDREILTEKEFKLWVHSLGSSALTNRVNIPKNTPLIDYARKFRLVESLDTIETIDSMLTAAQQTFNETVGVKRPSQSMMRQRMMSAKLSLECLSARLNLAPASNITTNDRLKIVFKDTKDELRVLSRDEFDPSEIDSQEVSKDAGVVDPGDERRGKQSAG